MTLAESLHEAYITRNEIMSPADIAEHIQEHEFESGVEYDAATILRSIREAGEQFVDSMRDNENDTFNDGDITADERDENIARWEAMRPSTIRQKAINAMINPAN